MEVPTSWTTYEEENLGGEHTGFRAWGVWIGEEGLSHKTGKGLLNEPGK